MFGARDTLGFVERLYVKEMIGINHGVGEQTTCNYQSLFYRAFSLISASIDSDACLGQSYNCSASEALCNVMI